LVAKTLFMKKLLKGILYVFGIILLIGIIAAIFTKPSEAEKTTSVPIDSTQTALKDSTNPPSVDTKWTYQVDSDKVTSEKVFHAEIDADAQLDLKFPYNGGVTATLGVRYKDGKNNVYLNISKGQFLANSLETENIKVRFDSEKAITYACSSASDGSSNIIFVNSADSFIENLKKSKHVVLQVELYDNGVQEMEFETANFNWKK